jgi:hypothetical protein
MLSINRISEGKMEKRKMIEASNIFAAIIFLNVL